MRAAVLFCAGLSLTSVALTASALGQEVLNYAWNGYEAEIPADPERVFVMESRTALEFALLAGFPVIATDWDETSHLVLDEVTERLSFRAEPNAELALSYEPDLLVVGRGWWNFWQNNGSFNSDGFDVLVIEDANSADWKELMVGQLEAVGRADQADMALASYDAAVAEARPIIAELVGDAPVAIADIWAGDQYVLHVDTFDAAVARDIGLNLVSSDAPIEDGYQAHSAENLDAFAGAEFIVLWGGDSPAVDNPLWQRLPAVEAGKVYELHTANSWGFALAATDFVADLVAYAEDAAGR
ncbi:ABC transporter substrate-binding protein [Pelagibacterium halotolerans]|uniref:Iron(III) dicitrate transport system, periplasmic iron-binding protein FecB n=1 Tax=Pelagibacterium halotolerans (strain DSM 22347 / JCM 15775 / CGMCC 1.7692 / B2) TaxID=1082931 RepID=G4R9P3_PELHB|nr:ABC transporter substrate-binding protein [Pelagibacterium halotolerans]AEQ51450.1 iron(III) dicitrate transport system, periplasmic iron-binding protein FecB [Pelagibacterium halotolerans B2]QJR18708.1 ABC transporter substrate-binding protein [Pelagibacterium halotolerans]SEA13868.1 iron complex transport system substrate-binding protein [Pelagibacterium halotolerans]